MVIEMIFTSSLFLCFCTILVSAEVYHIIASREDSNCTENFCLTLSDFVANVKSHSHRASTMLIFLPGNHSLESILTIRYGNFFMVSNHSSVIINCEEDAKFHFFNVNSVYINGLAIIGCKGHRVGQVKQFALINSTVSNHKDTAMYIYRSNVNITNSSFISNWGGITQQISYLLTFDHPQVGAAIVFWESNATIAGNVFMDNRAETGGAIFSTWESNVTIVASTFMDNEARDLNSYGGALYFEDKCTVKLINSTFQGNSAETNGGAITVVSQSSLSIHFSTFTFNEAQVGGVIQAYLAGEVTISDCNFTENIANKSGGVLSVGMVSHVNITGSKFEANRANETAGVIDALQSPFEINECKFFNNTAINLGGVFVAVFTAMTVNGSELIRNSAGYAGVVLMESQDHSQFTNCEFSHNTATVRGGVFIIHNTYLEIMSCVFASNRAFSGAVLHIQTDSKVEVENVTIENNTAEQGFGTA